MNTSKLILLTILLFLMAKANTQDLATHRWEDRLVLVFTEDTANETYRAQMRELRAAEAGLAERRIVVYQCRPQHYQQGLNKPTEWLASAQLYAEYKKSAAPFEVILMGLDGGVKLRQESLLTTTQLFGLIDQMPMRRAELRRKDKG